VNYPISNHGINPSEQLFKKTPVGCEFSFFWGLHDYTLTESVQYIGITIHELGILITQPGNQFFQGLHKKLRDYRLKKYKPTTLRIGFPFIIHPQCQPWMNKPLGCLIGRVTLKYQMTTRGVPP
jgi:hypothetical protein